MRIKFRWYGFKKPESENWRPLFWRSPVIRSCEERKHHMTDAVNGPDVCNREKGGGKCWGYTFGPVGILITAKCDHPKFK